MKDSKKRNALRAALLILLAIMLIVSCGKKESPAPATQTVSTPAPAKAAEPAKTTAPAATKPATPAKPAKVETPAPVVKVEEPAKVEAPAPEAPKHQVVEAIVKAAAYPVSLSTSINGDKFAIEAYDGYAFVTYPEKYDEEYVDQMMTALIAGFASDYSDQLGWSVENPGEAIIAYPFGLSPVQIAAFCQTIEGIALSL